MATGKLVFSQVIDHLPLHTFRQCVKRYQGNRKVKSFTCLDQFLCMAFAQLTYRESLRDIEACLRAQSNKLYHMGIRSQISRNTLANANKVRDWRIYADLAHSLIPVARNLYQNEDFGIELDQTVYALDATTIDLCLSLFPWAEFRQTKSAIKLHTLLDLRGSIPTFIYISDGKEHEVTVLDDLPLEAGAIYVMDRGYLDYFRLYRMTKAHAFFVIRAKKNMAFRRLYSAPANREAGLLCDQTIKLTGYHSERDYPEKLRRVRVRDLETDKTIVVLSNNFTLPAESIALLYRRRWYIEQFFRWIKQNLRIKAFYGTSENAVKTQIWIAVTVYLLVAIMKKRLKIEASLYTILQILSVTSFERVQLNQLLADSNYTTAATENDNQLFLFN
ncbi:transposase, IS4 family [Malonomonas rubra DSM 5091]|uniref:Transposase, IS4 family n=1 Tax=Malonomonas rubra DSM 5091 TaxID=1122189 RepID=A0A1M6KX48_MALRU|nr:IS4 family transposase [Malonomonas rubra]SHJ63446.1 transposase, IS4 family [Malonomonas rubra DSM 5091]